ncbi:MAG: ABC transporter ATP-binding protein [candidate division Zixibacteria bacterium]|nr:ABC transporter ATP-binding protein [candidate division Zixibacteria bacterium]
MAIRLSVENISKSFGARKVITDLSFTIAAPGALGIIGRNGSGKTTLLKLLCHLYRPTRGRIEMMRDDNEIKREDFFYHIKMVSPELALYQMLTGLENLRFFATVSGVEFSRPVLEETLDRVGLTGRGNDRVETYSAGMKQRLKYALSLLTSPPVLLLDEPTANLDDTGRKIAFEIMRQQREKRILVIATNEPEDLQNIEQIINLDN